MSARKRRTREVICVVLIAAFVSCGSIHAGMSDHCRATVNAAAADGMDFYFGSLHGHSADSGGTGTPAEVFAWARDDAGFDFYALTDHGEQLDQAEWEDIGQQADLFSQDGTFTAIRGFEWSNTTYGHINAFNTGEFTSSSLLPELGSFYGWLDQQGAAAQFNHPRPGGDFDGMAFEEGLDDNLLCLETANKSMDNKSEEFFQEYISALDRGWKTAPTGNQDNHTLSANSHRTVIVAPGLSRPSLMDALAARRCYSSDDPDMRVTFRCNGAWMGSEVEAPAGRAVFDIAVADDEPISRLELIGKGGTVAATAENDGSWSDGTAGWDLSLEVAEPAYYFLRVWEEDVHDDEENGSGVQAAVTAPVWVAPAAPAWYLAEGSTAWGFDCYLSIANPNQEELSVGLTYMTSTGAVEGPSVVMPAASQATVFPRQTLGEADFSTRVTCEGGKAISVDRTMYWTGPSSTVPEAHCAAGVIGPAPAWYLPEGSSDWAFECFLLIQNPNHAAADCTVTWMIEGGPPQSDVFTVAAASRLTVNMAERIGARDASIQVVADSPVVCERAMYRNGRREGHCSGGASAPAADYYLAEGCSGFGFTTYILVQNPNPTPTDVTIDYQAAGGPAAGPFFTMAANSRSTICVNDTTEIPGPDPSFSTRVHGSQPIVAERAMYWNGGDDYGQVCHDSIGLNQPHATWYLADGQTSEGRETWTLVQNPDAEPVTVDITYLTPDESGNVTRTETIAAGSRRSFNMIGHSGISGRAAIVVSCTTPGKKIICERAMYWNNRGSGTSAGGGSAD